MPKDPVRCPECDAGLALGPTVRPGARIRCPNCQTVFEVPAEAPEPVEAARRPRVRRRRPSRGGMPPGVLAGIVVGCVLLVAVAAIGGYYAFKSKGGAGGNSAVVKRPAPGNAVTGLAVGNLAPDIEDEDLDGVRFKLSDYRGKIVLLDFWGHW